MCASGYEVSVKVADKIGCVASLDWYSIEGLREITEYVPQLRS